MDESGSHHHIQVLQCHRHHEGQSVGVCGRQPGTIYNRALGKECREVPPGTADAKVENLIEEWEIPGGAVILTDGAELTVLL